jgi:hypothetical protein
MMKKPKDSYALRGYGLRPLYSPKVEAMIKDRARQHVSPLGGVAVGGLRGNPKSKPVVRKGR